MSTTSLGEGKKNSRESFNHAWGKIRGRESLLLLRPLFFYFIP